MNVEQFKNIDKYKVTELSDAIDKAIDVSFSQMIDTVRTQCYMSQTQDNWEDCDDLEFLEDIPMLFTDGRDIKESIKNQMKRVVISTLTDSDWVGKNDAMYNHVRDNSWVSDDERAKRNPNKFRQPPTSTDAKIYAEDMMRHYRKMERVVQGNFGSEIAMEFRKYLFFLITKMSKSGN